MGEVCLNSVHFPLLSETEHWLVLPANERRALSVELFAVRILSGCSFCEAVLFCSPLSFPFSLHIFGTVGHLRFSYHVLELELELG